MNKLYMKIRGFEETSCSLLVSFASDQTKSSNPEDYPEYAFQPLNMWPDVTDPTEIMKKIAVAGVYQVKHQEKEEMFKADPIKVEQFKSMVGSVTEFNLNQLVGNDYASDLTPYVEVL